jgi:hypothetical protein
VRDAPVVGNSTVLGIGGGVCNSGGDFSDVGSVIAGDHASTSNNDIFP